MIDIDTYIATNIESLLKFIPFSRLLDFILEQEDLHSAYRAIHPYLLKQCFMTYNRDLTFDLNLLPTINNIEYIADLLYKANHHITNNNNLGHRCHPTKLSTILSQIECDDLLNFVKLIKIYDEMLDLDQTLFDLNKMNYNCHLIQTLTNYSNYNHLENPILKLHFRSFEQLETVKLLNSLNYNFCYLTFINSLEIFDYLYNQTNFNEYLNYNFKNQLYIDPTQNILNYLESYHLIEISHKYLESELRNLINHFNLGHFRVLDIESLKFLNQYDYDFNNLEFYRRVDELLQMSLNYQVKLDQEAIVFLLDLELSDDLNILLYIYFEQLGHTKMGLYDKISKFKFTDYTKKLMFFNREQLDRILVKLDDINQIFYCISSADHLAYIFNHYDGFDLDKLVDSMIYRSNDLLDSVQAGRSRIIGSSIFQYWSNIIELFKKYDYSISKTKLKLIRDFKVHVNGEPYKWLSDILMEIVEKEDDKLKHFLKINILYIKS